MGLKQKFLEFEFTEALDEKTKELCLITATAFARCPT